MTLESLLDSLTGDERNFIAGLDYGQDSTCHRAALDQVIAAGGLVDFELMGVWYPYEVIELGKNWLQAGHEREYAACLGVVLRNIETGADDTNDVGWIIKRFTAEVAALPAELRSLVGELFARAVAAEGERSGRPDGAD